MKRHIFIVLSLIALACCVFLWKFRATSELPQLEFAESSLGTLAVEGVEYDSGKGFKREVFNRAKMVQLRSNVINNPIIVYGKVFPVNAVIEGDITIELGVGNESKSLRLHPELDAKSPGWWKVTIPGGSLAINQVYPVGAIYKGAKGGLLVDGMVTKVDMKQIAIASR